MGRMNSPFILGTPLGEVFHLMTISLNFNLEKKKTKSTQNKNIKLLKSGMVSNFGAVNCQLADVDLRYTTILELNKNKEKFLKLDWNLRKQLWFLTPKKSLGNGVGTLT